MAKIIFEQGGYNLASLFTEEISPAAKVVSKTSKGFVIEYNDIAETRAVVKGTNFSYGADGFPIKGTITNWSLASNYLKYGSASGLKMSAASLVAAARTWPDSKDDKALFSKVLSGNDVITGSFVNLLHGYGGNDTLIGGRGADELYGGKGADRFVYKSVHDSSPGIDGLDMDLDVIWDFSRSQKDKIDLKSIDANTTKSGNQAFSFIGTKAFTKAGQLRYEKDNHEGTGGINILGDVNGDGKADIEIFVAGHTKLIASDFFL